MGREKRALWNEKDLKPQGMLFTRNKEPYNIDGKKKVIMLFIMLFWGWGCNRISTV